MSDIINAFLIFGGGFILGGAFFVFRASRPAGYAAEDGKRYRLTEVDR